MPKDNKPVSQVNVAEIVAEKITNTSSISNELITALQNTKVIEALCSALGPCMQLIVEEVVQKNSETINKYFRELKEENKVLNSRLTNVEKENSELKEKLRQHEITLNKIEETTQTKLNEMERMKRSSNVVLSGLKVTSYAEAATGGSETTSEDTVRTVVDLCKNKLGVDVTRSDIVAAYRQPQRSSTSNQGQANSRPPNIVVTFSNTLIRDNVYHSRSKLKEYNKDNKDERIYVNEHLTAYDNNIYYEARNAVTKKKLASAFTLNGHVMVKTSGLITARATRIHSLEELSTILAMVTQS